MEYLNLYNEVHPELKLLQMHCINTLASKNNGNIRLRMQSLQFFQMRDRLIIEILISEHEIHYLEGILAEVSFEALANQNKFRESDAMTYIFKMFLESG